MKGLRAYILSHLILLKQQCIFPPRKLMAGKKKICCPALALGPRPYKVTSLHCLPCIARPREIALRGKMSSTSAAFKVKPLQNTVESVIREAKQKKKLLVLEFTAQSSEPCQRMKTVLEDVAGEAGSKAHIYEVDVDQYKPLAQRLGVETQKLPTFLVVKGKYVVDRIDGVVTKEELVRSIDENQVV